jgi:hypothetical protein
MAATDLEKLELVYSVSPHVVSRPTLQGLTAITTLTTRKQILAEQVEELDALIRTCRELLNP